ncbi:MAG: ABC transporter permease [Bdellovibrio sp.]|nr:ABC transporter permease [Bdellovibrio sp.]
MLLLFKLALRNLTRNRTRTILNLTMVIGAFASIVLFVGFSNYMLWSIEHGITKGQIGHIQVATRAIWERNSLKDKQQAYIADFDEIQKKIAALPAVEVVSGRANAQVLLSNGDKTVGGIALGFDPRVDENVEKALRIQEGQGFSKTNDFEVLVGGGLQTNLQLKVGQTLSVVSQTLAGSMSSLDLEVRGVVKSGFSDIDNSTVYIPLAAAQKLLDTNRIEKLSILLKSSDTLASTLDSVKQIIQPEPQLIAKDWKESTLLFQQLVEFYKVQNGVVKIILSVLVFFGILNTVGMSVYERIGEIGTMRALGDQQSEVLSLILFEGILLGLVGALIGIPVSYGMAFIFSALDIRLVLPGTSLPILIQITPFVQDYFEAGMAVIATCFVSSVWPARKALRMSIVDALRANS